MAKQTLSRDNKASSNKLLGHAMSAAKTLASKTSELVPKRTRTKAASSTSKKSTKPAAGSMGDSVKNHGDQLASAVQAVTKPARKNGSAMKSGANSAPTKSSKTSSRSATANQSRAQAASKATAKSNTKAVCASSKPAAKADGKAAASVSASKTSTKTKSNGVKAAANTAATKKTPANGKTATPAKSSARKTAGAAPVKDMPAEAPKGSTLSRSRAIPRGASGGTPAIGRSR